MDDRTSVTNRLVCAAIDSLKEAYQESTSIQVKQSIASAFTAISLLDYVSGKIDAFVMDDSCDPSEYCAAI